MELIGGHRGRRRVIMDVLKLDSGRDTTQRVDSAVGDGGERTAVAVTASARRLYRSRG